MTECLNEEMRDLLPLLAHGSLEAAEAERVRMHSAGCAECAAELAVLETSRLVLRASAPRVDVAAIAAAVGQSAAGASAAPVLRVERGGAKPVAAVARRSVWRSRQLLAAAASLLIVASLSLRLLDRTPSSNEGPSAPDTATVIATDPAPPAAAAGSELSVGDALVDLTSDDLSALLTELEGFDGKITIEPAAMRQPVVDTPGSR
ncbi:MAG: zf-HC2 domain-containing protein [Gemmatimonadetes bacterium]|nr:zf-HC2 domain-containing protein [Gemmatimonadota bacterium]